jgi:RNA polymerase sigma-70 factor (ECF subfamily)
MSSITPIKKAPINNGWKAWFEEHAPRLLLFARQQTRSAADAEDVLQNAVLKIWNARKRRNDGKDPTGTPDPAEIYTAIRRCAIDYGRRETRRTKREEKVIEFDLAKGVAWFECPFEHKERAKEVKEAIDRLPEPQKEVLVMKIWGELTFSEIGQTLQISENTAASRYRYALEALRRSLGKGKESHFKNLIAL